MTIPRGPTWWKLLLLAAVLWVGGYLRTDPGDPVEARHLAVAREMQANHDWFHPRLQGAPFIEVPPLHFWLMISSSVLTGGTIGGFAARLPGLLGAVLALWATARLTERWRDGPAAWRAVAALCTTAVFWWQGAWGRVDLLLCGLTTMSLWCFITASDPGRETRFAGAYLFAGFAMLAAGPIGLVLPVAGYVLLTWAGGEARLLSRRHWLWGPVLTAAVPGAWLLLAWSQDAPPDYFFAMLGAESSAPTWPSEAVAPFYHAWWRLPASFLPWLLFLPAAYHGLEAGALRRRLVTWAVVAFGLGAWTPGRHDLSIVAAGPAIALLVASGWDGIAGLTPRWHRMTGWCALGFVVLLGLVETGAMFHAAWPAARWTLVPGAILLLGGTTVLIDWFTRDGLTRRWFKVFAALVFTHLTLLGLLVLPSLTATDEASRFFAEARAQLPPGQPIHVFGDAATIVTLVTDQPGEYLDSEEAVEALVAGGDYGIIVCDQEAWDAIQPQFAERVRARPFRMGQEKLVWVDFPPPVAAQP